MTSRRAVTVKQHARRTPKTREFKGAHAVQQNQGAREYMEDVARLAEIEGGQYVGVFDGHGGDKAAQYAAAELHRVFREFLQDGVPAEDALRAAFLLIDNDIQESEDFSGTTATVAYIKDNELLMANVGDSEAIMVTDNGHRLLTELHNPDNGEEALRVVQAGGDIVKGRVRGHDDFRNPGWVQDLSMTRSLGDRDMRSAGVIPDPTVRKWLLHPQDQYLVVASDGIWNYFDTRTEVANVVRDAASPLQAARELITIIKKRHGPNADNITVAVVPVKAKGSSAVGSFNSKTGHSRYARGGF